MATLEAVNSKRILAGSALALAWIVLTQIHKAPLSVSDWAALVPLRCPLSFLLGISCPTCGLGRSLIAAALGHPQQSWHFHPLGLPLFWGGQALLLGWIIRPDLGQKLRALLRICLRQRVLIGCLILLYCIWGFALRAPL